MSDIDTGNYQIVGCCGPDLIIMRPKTTMSKKEALLHAAWLVVLGEDEPGQFQKILDAVSNT